MDAVHDLAQRLPRRTRRISATRWKQKFEALPKIAPFLAIIVGVMYVLYGGVATPSEAAGVGAALCVLLAIVDLPHVEGERLVARSCATRCASR